MNPNAENPNAANISLYGDGAGSEDFPVLKAFQQYIDAEQAKARKRMIALSAVFGCVTVVLILAFIFVIGYVNQQSNRLAERNQQLNDKLVEYALKQQERTAAAGNSDASSAALKAMTETMSRLQEQMVRQQNEALSAVKQAAAAPAKDAAADEARQRADEAKIRRATELLKAEKQKLAAEKERLHKEEVERQRRRLYPEYYARQDALAKAKEAAENSGDFDSLLDDIEDLESYDYPDDEDDVVEPVKKPATTAKKSATKKSAPAKKSATKKKAIRVDDISEDSAIDYFSDDSYTIPVESKSGKTKFRVPLK